ncbi:relaxase domain-containing protein [Streptomyces atroolivaceus]|uniref:relaxase domain-containing protein n=1 Tax=Streptomyces atroolivaceus TaxID=66869 RepID=UPI00341A8FD9
MSETADRTETDRLTAGASPNEAFKTGALGRRVMVTGVDFVFRPQSSIYLLWAFGDEETRRVIEAAHEYAIVRVLEWIEDEVAVIRYGKDGIHRVRPPGGLVAALPPLRGPLRPTAAVLGRFRSVSLPIPRDSEDQLCGRPAPGTSRLSSLLRGRFSSCPPACQSILGVSGCGTGGIAVVGDACWPGGVADGAEGYVFLSHPMMFGLRGRVLLSSLLCAWAHSVWRGTPEACRSDVRIRVICPTPAGS